MSLMHLLSVGQCFQEVEDRPGAYKMEPSHCLPNLASVTRCSAAPTRNSAATVSAPIQASLFAELVAGPALNGDKAHSLRPQKPAKLAPPLETPVLASVASPRFAAATAMPKVGPGVERTAPTAFNALKPSVFPAKRKDNQWKTMIKELFFGRRRRRPNGVNVQGELALEHLTVMRNDLNETDFEVVPTQAQSFAVQKPVVPPHKQARDWVRLTAGLIRPKKSEFHPSRGVASAAAQNQTPDLIALRR